MELTPTIKTEAQLTSPKSGRWSSEEDEQLRRIVPFYGEKQWRKISLHMKGRTAIQCLHRWTKILKPGLVKGPWTEEEDRKLRDWVGREGPGKWSQCSSFIVGRSGKQCRERWFNNLNPVVKKGCWTEEEDDLIFKLYMQFGSSWSKIAKNLNGRTENSIKNRFYSTIRKIAADRRKVGVKEEEEEVKKKEEESSFGQNINLQANNTLYRLLQEKGELYESHIEVVGKKKESCSSKKNEIFEDKSECDSEAQFEDLLSSIEKTLNKELMMKEINSCKDMTLDELQQKVFMFCNNNIMEFKYDEPDLQNDLSEINKKIHQEMFPYNVPSENNLTLNSAKILKETPLLNINMPPSPNLFNSNLNSGLKNTVQIKSEGKVNNNAGEDNKMFFLIQQLHSLEGMLSNTREELMKLESSIGTSEKNNSTAIFSCTNSNNQNNNHIGQMENNNNNNALKYDDFDYLFDQRTNGNIFNDLILLENSIFPKPTENMNVNNLIGSKRNNPYEGELTPDILKKQKIGMFDFDRNSANFLNNILEDNQ